MPTDPLYGLLAKAQRRGDIWKTKAIEIEADRDRVDKAVEAHRLALSEALGLGTGAPWDAIRDRAAEVAANPPADRAAILREAADGYERLLGGMASEAEKDPRYWTAVRDVVVGLRRMADDVSGPGRVADEAQQPETRKRPPMDPVHILGIDADDPAAVSQPGKESTS